MARILVADDNVEQITVQRKLFGALGYQVETASTPSEALQSLAATAPDLILIDLHFPRVSDGLGLIRAVRDSGYTGPLVVLSGWPDEIYNSPEEKLVTRIVVKGSMRELLQVIAELVGKNPAAASAPSQNLPSA